jgi:hypothetical protein
LINEAAIRDLVHRDVKRARGFRRGTEPRSAAGVRVLERAAAIDYDTELVIHGTADPIFPVENRGALAHEIPKCEAANAGRRPPRVEPADRERITAAIIDHKVESDHGGISMTDPSLPGRLLRAHQLLSISGRYERPDGSWSSLSKHDQQVPRASTPDSPSRSPEVDVQPVCALVSKTGGFVPDGPSSATRAR